MSAEVVQISQTIALNEAEQEEIRSIGRLIDSVWGMASKATKELGWLGAQIESKAERGAWVVLGCKDQHDFRIARGISRSNWYRHVGIALKFVGRIEKELYTAMTLENAERLAVENSEIRYDEQLIRDAASMSIREFADKLATLGAHAEGKSKRQRYAEMRLRLEETTRDYIENGVRGWCQENGIELRAEDGIAYGLQLMVAELADGPTLVGYLLEAVPRIAKAARTSEDVVELRDMLVDFLVEINNRVNLRYGDSEDLTAAS